MGNNAVLNQNQRTFYQGWAADKTVLAADDPSTTSTFWVQGVASYTLYVNRITVSVTTDNAATLTFQDSAGTPVIIAKSKVSPGLTQLVWDFGEDGTPLTEGKHFNIAASAAGLGARVHAEGYLRQTSNLTL